MWWGGSNGWRFLLGILPPLLAGCQQHWVAPYDAGLQKRAVDMLADLSAWEGAMRGAAGTLAADPRHPDVKARLQAWSADIEAMAAIELAIDPGSASCDRLVQGLAKPLAQHLPGLLPSAAPSATASGGSAPLSPHCESLPDIFGRMQTEISERFPEILAEQCRLPWLSDDYFQALAEARASTGAAGPDRTPLPAAADRQLAQARCGALFETLPGPSGRPLHGDLVGPLVTELDAIIYREGRQAPAGGK